MITDIQKYINCLKNRWKELDAKDSISDSPSSLNQAATEMTVLDVIIEDLKRIENSKFSYWNFE